MGGDGIKMSRFFVNKGNIHPNSIMITGEDINHIKNVLRLKCGSQLTVCDCGGRDYVVSIERFGQDLIETRIIETAENRTEPPIDITLYQGIPKSDKMDLIIQKSIELGAARIVPVITERTVVKFNGNKDAEHKVSRWRRIALEAAKQCNRGIVPEVLLPVAFQQAVADAEKYDLSLIPYEKENEKGLKHCLNVEKYQKISLFIGPEGGFSEEEIAIAISSGIKPVTLGPRILRTETAGIAALSILMYELGDVGK